MTTANKHHSFYGPPNSEVSKIAGREAVSSSPDDRLALIDLGKAGDLYLAEPDHARQLLAAAFEAVRILDPDGAADAVFALIEGDALAKIRARIREEEVRKVLTVPGATVLGEVHVCYWCGIETSTGLRQCAGGGDYADKWECADPDPCRRRCADDLKADAAPDTAQPEDIPEPDDGTGCPECGAVGFPRKENGTCWNAVGCRERQAAKASAR